MMHRLFIAIPCYILLITCGEQKMNDTILIFTKTAQYRHESIDSALAALKKFGDEQNIMVEKTDDSLNFNDQNLQKYAAVVFLNTSGDVLGTEGKRAFRKYIENGGGYVGVHGACDTEYEWPWYGELVGTYFKNHPEIQPAMLKVIDNSHISTRHLPSTWERTDEWYNFRTPLDPTVKVLITLDETSYVGGENGPEHPFSWYHKVGNGRAWYTAGGHTNESYQDSAFLKHLSGGILYAADIE